MQEKVTSIKTEIKISSSDREIVSLLSNGYSVPQIADKLKIKKRTLEAKVDRLKVRLECANVVNLVSFFLRKNIIE